MAVVIAATSRDNLGSGSDTRFDSILQAGLAAIVPRPGSRQGREVEYGTTCPLSKVWSAGSDRDRVMRVVTSPIFVRHGNNRYRRSNRSILRIRDLRATERWENWQKRTVNS